MIRSFSCEGFRNVSCSDIAFERINILIGPNNAGKSNFIRALSFAANMVDNQKSESTGFLTEIKRNGWNQIADRRMSNNTFSLTWTFEIENNRPVKYKLKANVGETREENYICEESLDSAEPRMGSVTPYNFFHCHVPTLGTGAFSSAGMEKQKNTRLHTSVSQTESVLLQLDSLFFLHKELFSTKFVRENIRQVLEAMRTYFKSFYSYSCTAFHISEIREMRDAQDDGSKLKKDGSNFVNVYCQMDRTDPTFKSRYMQMIKKLIGNCNEVNIQDAGGKIWMELIMDGYSFPLSEVSDGTIHLLILLLLLSMPEENAASMLAIDEPEMNLHPAWQILLADEILHCHGFRQCFISTHSPDFLDAFTQSFLEGNAAVFVFDPSSRFKIRRLDSEELKADLKHWTLGDLYRVGDPAIGGWPQ